MDRFMQWSSKQVLVIGAARQGVSLARFLALHGAQVVLNDLRPVEALAEARLSLVNLPVTWACGGHPLELLDDTDLICPSGGVPLNIPLIVEAQRRGIPLSNDSQIFLEVCPCRTVGITGSAGKTTTTSLVGQMVTLARGEESTWVGGNIGMPLLSIVDQITADDLAVMELSSFQLEIMTRSVNIAAVLNITPNHLDRHGTMEAYRLAKGRIISQQTPQDCVVLGRDDPGSWSLASQAHGKVLSFGFQRPPDGRQGSYLDGEQVCLWDGQNTRPILPRKEIHLRGEHNVHNVLAACAVADAAGVPVEAMRTAIEGFYGVPHRLEWVRSWNGAVWYNDSIATAPERAMAAIHSFDEPIVLLAGGRDKNLPWDDFSALVHQRVDHLILFGEAADLIYWAVHAVAASDRPYTLERCDNLEQAVQAAARIAKPGDVVLLSPGGTSFDEFRDFERRGEAFKKWVLELA
jgi:UDP-N-acetylmuramoylalanine--D-glutamate ligase